MELREKIKDAPQAPGCYLFKDKRGRVIYVGKAKNIRNRVRQYFRKGDQPDDKGQLIGQLAVDVEFVLMPTERDALLREYQLIKHLRPRFNVQHKRDRKTYCLRVDRSGSYPTLVITADQAAVGEYLGTFTSTSRAEDARVLLNRVFRTPLCARPLDGSRDQPCLHYSVGRCLGPCAGRVTIAEYEVVMREITRLFQGRQTKTLMALKRRMASQAKALEFEKAAQIKQDLDELRRLAHGYLHRLRIPERQDCLVFYRAYHEPGCSLYVFHSGEALWRRDYAALPGPPEITAVLAETAGAETPGTARAQTEALRPITAAERPPLKEGLQHVYADKLAVSLPRGWQPEKAAALVAEKLQQWT